MRDDPAMPGQALEVKFKDLENMDFTKLREFRFALSPKNIKQFATGFKIQDGPLYTGTGYGAMGTAPVGSEFPGLDNTIRQKESK